MIIACSDWNLENPNGYEMLMIFARSDWKIQMDTESSHNRALVSGRGEKTTETPILGQIQR